VSALALALGLLALASCGSSSSSKTSPAATPATTAPATTPTPAPASTAGGQKLSLESNPEGQLKYNAASLTAKAGTVSIDFTNMAPLSHNLTVASASGAVLGATPTFQGGSKTLSLTLKAGTYKFYCTVPGHRAAGMEGTLTVQ
jgi:plastocyanin